MTHLVFFRSLASATICLNQARTQADSLRRKAIRTKGGYRIRYTALTCFGTKTERAAFESMRRSALLAIRHIATAAAIVRGCNGGAQ